MTNHFHPPVERAAFLEAMSRIASTVNIVTTDGPAGRDGMAITSMVPVSADMAQPTLLVCVNRKTGTCQEIKRSGRFSVQLLGADQADLALCFAGATGATGAGKFDSSDWTTCAAGLPRLRTALASLSCQVLSSSENGSHMVFIGAIEEAALQEGEALIYARSKFRRLETV